MALGGRYTPIVPTSKSRAGRGEDGGFHGARDVLDCNPPRLRKTLLRSTHLVDKKMNGGPVRMENLIGLLSLLATVFFGAIATFVEFLKLTR